MLYQTWWKLQVDLTCRVTISVGGFTLMDLMALTTDRITFKPYTPTKGSTISEEDRNPHFSIEVANLI